MGPEFKTKKKKNASIMGNVLPPNNSVFHKSQVQYAITWYLPKRNNSNNSAFVDSILILKILGSLYLSRILVIKNIRYDRASFF